MNRRVRPQDLQERPAFDGRSPLIRLIDDIPAKLEKGRYPKEPWFPGKWAARERWHQNEGQQTFQLRLRIIRVASMQRP